MSADEATPVEAAETDSDGLPQHGDFTADQLELLKELNQPRAAVVLPDANLTAYADAVSSAVECLRDAGFTVWGPWPDANSSQLSYLYQDPAESGSAGHLLVAQRCHNVHELDAAASYMSSLDVPNADFDELARGFADCFSSAYPAESRDHSPLSRAVAFVATNTGVMTDQFDPLDVTALCEAAGASS